jgi:23S rRNA pseudouridine2605 synthase
MNDTQHPSDATDAELTPGQTPTSAAEAAVAAPKRRRPRKADAAAAAEPAAPAVEAVAVPAEPVAAAPAVKRTRTRKPAAAAAPVETAEAAEVAVPAEVPVAPVAEAAPEVVAAPEATEKAAESKPKRAPRRRATPAAPAEVAVALAVPEQAPTESAPGAADVAPLPVVAPAEAAAAAEAAESAGPAPVVEAAPAAADADADAADPAAASDTDEATRARESTRRRRDRNRSRLQRERAAAEGAEAAEAADAAAAAAADGVEARQAVAEDPGAGLFSLAPEPEQVDVTARFADVISGNYDSEDAGEVADVAEAGKRVLRPEPEAPKLHKVLAQAGIGSRREMEQLIVDGKVQVNGEAAHLGMRITFGDQIKVGGKPIKFRIAPPPARVLAYHKPVGEVVTFNDPEGRPTVFRRLPRLPNGKWQSVGRLDLNTEGLLLFTNSGELANQLMHPRFGVEREYAARVLGTLTEEQRAQLLAGVEIEGQKAGFKSIEDGGGEGVNHWYRVVITEGRNREVRKLFETVGMAVSRLIRIRYGTIVLPRGLKRGVWVELDDNDVRQIRRQASAGDAPNRAERGEQRGESRGEFRVEPRAERSERAERGARPERDARGGQPKGGQAPRQDTRGQGKGPARKGGGQFGQADRRDGNRPAPRDARESRDPDQLPDDDDMPLRIPNPLEQTFDRRFATGSKRISAGFGRPSEEPIGGPRNDRKGGPKQPDPMQTSVGYIGADAYFTKPGGNRGGRSGGGGGGGGGGRSGGGGRR